MAFSEFLFSQCLLTGFLIWLCWWQKFDCDIFTQWLNTYSCLDSPFHCSVYSFFGNISLTCLMVLGDRNLIICTCKTHSIYLNIPGWNLHFLHNFIWTFWHFFMQMPTTMIVLLISNHGKYSCKAVYGRNMHINSARRGILFVVEITTSPAPTSVTCLPKTISVLWIDSKFCLFYFNCFIRLFIPSCMNSDNVLS